MSLSFLDFIRSQDSAKDEPMIVSGMAMKKIPMTCSGAAGKGGERGSERTVAGSRRAVKGRWKGQQQKDGGRRHHRHRADELARDRPRDL